MSVRERVLLRAWTHLCRYVHACACTRVLICVLLWAYTSVCARCIYRRLNAGVQLGVSWVMPAVRKKLLSPGPKWAVWLSAAHPPAPGLQQLPGGWLSTASLGSCGQKWKPGRVTRPDGGRPWPGQCSWRPPGVGSRVSVTSSLHCPSQVVMGLWRSGKPSPPHRKSSELLRSLLPSGCVSVGRDLQGFRLRREPAPADHHPVLPDDSCPRPRGGLVVLALSPPPQGVERPLQPLSHDQLVLTGSSDSRVILSNMVSILPSPSRPLWWTTTT